MANRTIPLKKTADKILIIDDDKTLMDILSQVLHEKGFYVTVARDGNKALKKIKDNFYAVMLIDIKLPDIDGIELISKMHKTDPDMRKIILTGNPSLDNIQKALKGGAHDYLIKPAKLDDILNTIETQLTILQKELKDRYKTIN